MSLSFIYQDSCLVSPEDLQGIVERLQPEIARVAGVVRSKNYSDSYGFINAPFDIEYHDTIVQLAHEKRALNPKLVVLIGIGGSSLGTLAIHEALHGRFYNSMDPDISFYCADTLDSKKNHAISLLVEKVLKRGEVVLYVIVSKSGTTTETMVNAALFLDLLKHYHPHDYQSYCVMITDQGSVLESYGRENGCSILTIPKKVGGRYSVFTAVGLFPLALLGVDIERLCRGAAHMVLPCTQGDKNNYAALSAAILFYHYSNGTTTHDSFFFDDAHESLGKWYRQLMAESLGKEYGLSGNCVEAGMLPTVSLGTVDLHSMVQLYLGGPKKHITTFIAVETCDTYIIPNVSLAIASGRSVSVVQNAIFNGVRAAYLKKQCPFITITGLDQSPESCGAYLQFKMLEIVYLGFLMQVNPFDQPHVELYKKEVCGFLEKKER